jgi:hypothetical protein
VQWTIQGLDQAASGRTRSGRLFWNAALSLPRTSLAKAFGNQEGSARRAPVAAVIGNAAPGDQAMDMRAVEQLLGPGAQDGEDADRGSDVAWIAGEFDDGLGGGLHQQGVTVTLVGAQRVPEFFRHGDGDVEIRDWQHLGLAGLEPALGLSAMTFGTTPVLAGVIGQDLGVALFATPEPPSERLGAAGLDVGDGAPVRWQHRRAVGRQVIAAEAAKDVGDLDHDGPAAPEAGHQCVEDGFERDAGGFGEVG